MTKSELANAIIERCNQEFDRKCPTTGAFPVATDLHVCYSDIFCLIDRYDKSQVVVKKKSKRDFLKEI